MEKVTAGSPLRIPAATFNSFIDAAQAVKDMQAKTSVQKKNTNSGLIVIENNSGGDLEAYDILGIDDPITTPTTDEDRFCEYVAFGGSTPDETKHIAKWALLLEPVASGEVGRAAVNGVFPAKINVIDEDHTHAEMSDGSSTLDSSPSGAAQIIWKESGTGEKWATIRIDGGLGQLAEITEPVNMFILDEDDRVGKFDTSDSGANLPIITTPKWVLAMDASMNIGWHEVEDFECPA